MFSGKVVKTESVDPNYKIKFSYKGDEFEIYDGEAVFTRKSPLPKIVFDSRTDHLIKKSSSYQDIIKKIELELGKTVLEHIINNTHDLSSLWVSDQFLSKNNGPLGPLEPQRKTFLNNSNRSRK
ncbi:MAG: hypothetical protein N3I35_07355 [Clostridia bacterium]|nr:hypothetical protein [Clostridia bacterium]